MQEYRPTTLTERLGFMAYLYVVGGGRDLGSLVDDALSDERGVGDPTDLQPAPRPLGRTISLAAERGGSRVEQTAGR